MPEYIVSVTYGDDRVRTYGVKADNVNDAEACVLDHALDLLSVAVEPDEAVGSSLDDAVGDGELDDVFEVHPGDTYARIVLGAYVVGG